MLSMRRRAGMLTLTVTVIVKSRRPFLCLLEFRSGEKEPSDFSDGGMEIKFCPWCGTNLNEQYGQLW